MGTVLLLDKGSDNLHSIRKIMSLTTIQHKYQTTPSNDCSRNVIPPAPNISKSCLKRLRSSPNDDDGCAALSDYLHLQKTARHENIFCEVSKTSSHFIITAE